MLDVVINRVGLKKGEADTYEIRSRFQNKDLKFRDLVEISFLIKLFDFK